MGPQAPPNCGAAQAMQLLRWQEGSDAMHAPTPVFCLYSCRMNDVVLLFPDFSLILCGYLVCRYTALNREVWQQVENLVYFLLFPVMLFYSIVRSPLDVRAASQLIAAGWTLAACGIALSYSVRFWPFVAAHTQPRDHAASAQIGFRFNSFIGLAIAERVAGSAGVQGISVLIGICVPVFNVAAIWPMARQGQHGFAGQLLRNPLIIATVSGLAANLMGFVMPHWLEPTVQRIGAASLAMGLMAAGAGMQLKSLHEAKTLAAALLSIKHLLLPLLAWALSRLYQLDPLQTTVLLAFSALPTASSSYVLAARMGYNGSYIAALVTLSTLLGLVSLPLALGVLR